MNLVFLGDVHGDIRFCNKICSENPSSTIIQIGDLGVGFVNLSELENLPKNFRFFPGNHDCRQLARTIPAYLGDFGTYFNIFYVSGANSIDKHLRTEGISWWPDEELSQSQLYKAIGSWEKSKSEILVTHDCPQSIAQKYFNISDKSRTRQAIQSMIEIRKPKLIVHAHHHLSKRFSENGISYICLGINETYKL